MSFTRALHPAFGPAFGPPFSHDGFAGFSPLDIPDLQFWYDPSDLTTIDAQGSLGNEVASIANKSEDPTGEDLAEGNTAQRPLTGTVLLNGLNALEFDGVDDRLKTGIISTITSSMTIFAVASITKTDNSASPLMSFNSSPRFDLFASVADEFYGELGAFGMGIGAGTLLSPDNLLGSPYLLTYVLDFAANSVKMRVNGVEVDSVNTYTISVFPTQVMAIGADPSNLVFAGMRMGEYAHYKRALTQTEIDNMEAYLLQKWIFTPTQISGLWAWYDAADISNASINIISGDAQIWRDKNGTAARDLAQNTPANRPAIGGVMNGLNTITFDSSNQQFLKTGGPLDTAGLADQTLFVVWNSPGGPSGVSTLNWNGSTNTLDYNIEDSDPGGAFFPEITNRGLGIGSNLLSALNTSNKDSQFTVLLDAAQGTSKFRIAAQGEENQELTDIYNGAFADTVSTLRLATDSESVFMSVDMAELVIYEGVLAAEEIFQVERYLQEKWGINDPESLFSPADIANLILWYSASDIEALTLEDTDRVVNMENLANPGVSDMTATSTSAERPTTGAATINGLNVLVFDGAAPAGNVMETAADFAATVSNSAFVVFRPLSSGNNNDSIYSFTGTNFYIIRALTQGQWRNRVQDTGLGIGNGLQSSVDLLGSVILSEVTLNGSAPGENASLFISGVQEGPTDMGYNADFSTPQGLLIGANDTSTRFLHCEFAEFIYYNEALSTSESNQVTAYLKSKWGI